VTHVEGSEIDWAETDQSVQLSKRGMAVPPLSARFQLMCHGLILCWKRPSADSTLTALVGRLLPMANRHEPARNGPS
jgi:hypothetical protein